MLSPYRVLDLTDERGLLCGQILADLGADVIAIEPPGGNPTRQIGPFAGDEPDVEGSLTWWANSRGKRSVVLDLETPGDRGRLLELVRSADFLIESSDPGTMAGLGLGYDELAAVNEALIYVSISAFGGDGPKANWAATDLTVWAAGGTMPTMGDADRPPIRLSVPQSWSHAGALAAVGAMVALSDRANTGLGQHVDISAQQAVALTTMSQILNVAWNTPELERAPGAARVQSLHKLKDGWGVLGVMYGAQNAHRTRRLMELAVEAGCLDPVHLDIDWGTYLIDAAMGKIAQETVDAVNEGLSGYAATLTKDELFDVAMANKLWLAPVNNAADVVASEQLEARQYWEELATPKHGTVKAPGRFFANAGMQPAWERSVASIGEHTEEVFAEARAAERQPAMANGNPLPLEGLKVLDFSWVMAAPAALRMLADWGATIVHIESANRLDLARTSIVFKDGEAGLENSGWWQNLAMGKKSITLNLSNPESKAIVLDLAKWADLVVESYSPGQLERWGLGFDELRAANPDLITLSSSLLGHTGPKASYTALGTQASPLMGFWDVTGWEDRPPIQPTGAYTDLVAPWYTATLILAALDDFRRTGKARNIDFGQGESAIAFLSAALLDASVNGHVWSRMGNDDRVMAPHGAYETADGEWIAIACRDDDDWVRLCGVIERDELIIDASLASAASRLERRRDLDEIVGEYAKTQTVDALEAALQGANVPAHRVQNSKECLADPQLQARGHFVQVPHPIHGPVTIEGTRMKLSRTEDAVKTHGPMMGEHNDWVLREVLGYGDERVVEIVSSGAMA